MVLEGFGIWDLGFGRVVDLWDRSPQLALAMEDSGSVARFKAFCKFFLFIICAILHCLPAFMVFMGWDLGTYGSVALG